MGDSDDLARKTSCNVCLIWNSALNAHRAYCVKMEKGAAKKKEEGPIGILESICA